MLVGGSLPSRLIYGGHYWGGDEGSEQRHQNHDCESLIVQHLQLCIGKQNERGWWRDCSSTSNLFFFSYIYILGLGLGDWDWGVRTDSPI